MLAHMLPKQYPASGTRDETSIDCVNSRNHPIDWQRASLSKLLKSANGHCDGCFPRESHNKSNRSQLEMPLEFAKSLW